MRADRKYGGYSAAVETALRSAGIDPDQLRRCLMPDAGGGSSSDGGLGSVSRKRYWAALEQLSGNSEIGLHLCAHLSWRSGELLFLLVQASPTVRSGLRLLERWSGLMDEQASMRLEEESPAHARLVISLPESWSWHDEVLYVRLTQLVLQAAFGDQWSLRGIQLKHPGPQQEDTHKAAFACEVSSGATATCLRFDAALLDQKAPWADMGALEAYEALALRRRKKQQQERLIIRLREVLDRLSHGQALTLEHAARQLGVSPRYLRYVLSDRGTSFSKVSMEQRLQIASTLLLQKELSIGAVAEQAGFSECSAFYRAFRRWTGCTPAQFRRQISSTGVLGVRGGYRQTGHFLASALA